MGTHNPNFFWTTTTTTMFRLVSSTSGRASVAAFSTLRGAMGGGRTAGGHPTSEALKARKTDEAELKQLRLYHKSGLALAVAAPLALVLPSSVMLPVDAVLSAVVPFHAYVGSAAVVEDYIPRKHHTAAKTGLLLVAGLMSAGLFKSTFFGDGPTAAVKALWADNDTPSD